MGVLGVSASAMTGEVSALHNYYKNTASDAERHLFSHDALVHMNTHGNPSLPLLQRAWHDVLQEERPLVELQPNLLPQDEVGGGCLAGAVGGRGAFQSSRVTSFRTEWV